MPIEVHNALSSSVHMRCMERDPSMKADISVSLSSFLYLYVCEKQEMKDIGARGGLIVPWAVLG